MLKYLVIGIGRLSGAIGLYVVGSFLGERYGVRFPSGMTGSFLIGFVLVLLAKTSASPYWRYLVPIGFIGAYTTFSTFEYETLRVMQDDHVTAGFAGLANVILSVAVGFAAVWVGAAPGKVVA